MVVAKTCRALAHRLMPRSGKRATCFGHHHLAHEELRIRNRPETWPPDSMLPEVGGKWRTAFHKPVTPSMQVRFVYQDPVQLRPCTTVSIEHPATKICPPVADPDHLDAALLGFHQ